MNVSCCLMPLVDVPSVTCAPRFIFAPVFVEEIHTVLYPFAFDAQDTVTTQMLIPLLRVIADMVVSVAVATE